MNIIHPSSKLVPTLVTSMIVLTITLTASSTSQTIALSAQEAIPACDQGYTLSDADSNEPAEVVQLYWEGIELMRQGHWGEARAWYTDALSHHPESRHLHEGLTQVLWYLAVEEHDKGALEQANHEVVKAVEIGLGFGKVRHTWLLSQILGRTGDIKTLDALFERGLTLAPTFMTYLDYARGLSLLNDRRAEATYKRAIELQPKGNIDALAYYSEWLLDHGREKEALAFLPADAHVEYLHFLRGVALEKLNRPDEAKAEYAQFATFSGHFPAPERFKIQGSRTQAGIQFENNVMTASVTDSQARVGLSALIYGEAGGEASGGQRAEGWVVFVTESYEALLVAVLL